MVDVTGDASLDTAASVLIVFSSFVGIVTALYYFVKTKSIAIAEGDNTRLLSNEDGEAYDFQKVAEITEVIASGAKSFLYQEYRYMAFFIAGFGILVFLGVSLGNRDENNENTVVSWSQGGLTTLAFVLGGVTSIISGYIGMTIAVIANGRVAVMACNGYPAAFQTAFRAGAVMGFALCSLALIVLFITIVSFRSYYEGLDMTPMFRTEKLYDAIAGYGLGGSSIALFGRVGGGIYTKAADVGADLVGKVEQGIPEDDPRNPAVIADNVGDNVGDIAGMGADLFGSFAESTCAALVVSAFSPEIVAAGWHAQSFPLLISATGILVCFVTSFLATHLRKVTQQSEIEPALKLQLVVSTVLMSAAMAIISKVFLPDEITLQNVAGAVKWHHIYACGMCGLWAGLITGFVTEYYTSHSYTPVREVADSCNTGAATNIIYGLALGYKSAIVPVLALTVTIWVSFTFARMYGVAIAALGILSTLAIGLTIDAYGPISDNAGGIAEMSGLGPEVRERTDALDAAGNTTAAIGKGFAIGSAALVSLALFGGFTTRANITEVDLLEPYTFAGLFIGAMLPYWFSALTMKSVGKAALAMVEEVRRQFREMKGIMEGTTRPDYERCVAISTTASLREMIAPGVLVMGSPLLVGVVFGAKAVSGLLAGALVSGVLMALSSSNTGGAWDNAKKYIETGAHGGKHSDAHKAAVVGDTVGDPLKDTSGPALNILIKLMAVESLVFATLFITDPFPLVKHF